tara:strand:+ start:834 stop:1460 length:627 start_codon:yes stop_codon:yes gene_type:complete
LASNIGYRQGLVENWGYDLSNYAIAQAARHPARLSNCFGNELFLNNIKCLVGFIRRMFAPCFNSEDAVTSMNLKPSLARLKRKIAAFSDTRGAVSVEFVLWVPVFVLILAITVDATILFKTQANLWTVARDAGRQMSTGLYSNSQAEDYAAGQFASWGITGTATASQTNDTVTMQISVPVAAVTPFRIVNAFTDGNIIAVVTQRKEPQ